MKKHDLFSRELPFLGCAVLVGVLCYLANLTPFGQWLYKTVDLPALYEGRNFLGFSPQLDRRLKIYVYDDLTTSSLKATDLSASRWVEVLAAAAKSSPTAIITPYTFSVPKNLHNPIEFTESLTAIESKIATGVWLTKTDVSGLLPLDPEDYPSLSLKRHYGLANPGELTWNESVDNEPKKLFGPHPGAMNAFRYFGANWVYSHRLPLITVLDEESALAHLALHAAESVTIDHGSLYINDHKVPLEDDGFFQVNYMHPSEFFERIQPLLGPVRRVMRSLEFDEELAKGDVILILPSFMTGMLSYVDTPFGKQPEGYVTASIINSVLTENWFPRSPRPWAFFAVTMLIGMLFGRFVKRTWVVLVTLSLCAASALGMIIFFSLKGVSFPVTLGCAGLFLGAVSCAMIRKSRHAQRYEEALRTSRYLFGRNGTRHIEKRYTLVPDAPTKKIISLVQLNLVDTENTLRQLHGETLYDEFRHFELLFTKIIHEAGGIEVKTIAGRKLGLFSSTIAQDDKTLQNHAEKAVRCADVLARELTQFIDERFENGDLYPLFRVAVMSAPIHLGNFGDKDHLVATVLGVQVNQLSELANVCPVMRVAISGSTYALLDAKEFANLKEKTLATLDDKLTYFIHDPVPEHSNLIKEIKARRKAAASASAGLS